MGFPFSNSLFFRVSLSAPIQNLSGAIAPLPESIVDVAQLVGVHCAAQR